MHAVKALDAPPTEAELPTIAEALLRERIPRSWSLELQVLSDGRRPDSYFLLRAPDGTQTKILVHAKRLVDVRDISPFEEHLERYLKLGESIGMVVARYLPPSVRDRLAQSDLSYADATGNILLRTESPALFVSDKGDNADPWRGRGRPRGTLKGEPAAKVVRAMLDRSGPWKIRELVSESGASTGSVYRVIEFLEAEELVQRTPNGFLSCPDWPALLRRWSLDYQFQKSNMITRWIAPRGLEDLLNRARTSTVQDYAVTGSIAAAHWAANAPARSAMIYTVDPQRAAEEWGLRPTESGVNVLLAKPAYAVALKGARIRQDGLRLAAPAQVAVDLITGPGRAPSEAEELIDWMVRNEQFWR
ncbi:hypothetical protein ACIQTZ_13360 [Paenarthrobacter sp. NPDC090520]|uniref:hypothetical protein n=1 Tax=Paenarthrobacter sp. NPDC090520 TaxID=3364382 RepID=UPI0037F1B903